MRTIYHPLGFWNGLLRGPGWHLREWIRSSDYRALHRFAGKLKGVPRRRPTQLKYAGRPIQIMDGPSFLSAWDEIFVNRIYDIEERSGRRPVLVDAGANIGLAALYWKIRYGDFDYIGFEPDRDVAACCRRNLAEWDVKGELIEAAVSEHNGEVEFVSDGADGGRLASVGDESVTKVKAVRLSSYLPEVVDFLKIDVEGAETCVLHDITAQLGRINALFIEWHCRSGKTGLGTAIELLESAGFECHMQVAIGQARPFGPRLTSDIFFQNINLYGVRR